MKIIACLLALAGFAHAQSFEVASIKPSPLAAEGRVNGRMNSDPGRIRLNNVSIQNLLAQAYLTRNFQTQGPSGLAAEHYDIEAKLPGGPTPEQMPAMFQHLLQERFKLDLHRESRPMNAYVI